MENTDKIIKEYLLEKGASFSGTDDEYSVRWPGDSSAFTEGWTIGCLDGEMLGYVTLDVGYRIRGVEDDSLAEAMWRDLKDMYPDVSFRGHSSLMAPAGEVHLSIFKVLDGQPGDVVRCLDSSIPTLAEAAFSLMSRYDREYPVRISIAACTQPDIPPVP